MSSTHLSLYYHVVFSTKDRRPLITEAWRGDLHAFLGGCVKAANGVPEKIGGVDDHVHLLLGLRATHCLADFMRDIKTASSKWAHENRLPLFAWQEGYGAFTVSTWIVPVIKRYIERQEEHHSVRSFRSEYIALLKRHGVEFDPDSLW